MSRGQMTWRATWQLSALGLAAASLVACGSNKPKPADLEPNPAKLSVSQAWAGQIGAVNFPLQVRAVGDQFIVASTAGDVVSFDSATGQVRSRVQVGAKLHGGVGSDGQRMAVVTESAHLVVLADGKEAWRRSLNVPSFSAPLVAGGRVFVLGGDRSVRAYDAASGQLLWNQASRSQEPLVLRHSGLITAVGNTLVVGQGGRMAGVSPDDGHLLWEVPLASPRGTNDVEKLADLMAPAARDNETLCVRAFQASVGCVDTSVGRVDWTKANNGSSSVSIDGEQVYGVTVDGIVQAWGRKAGENKWSSSKLRYRELSAPLAIGNTVVVGDAKGLVHMLSKADGSLLNRLPTDGSRIAVAPVAVGDKVVVVTEKGGVFAFKPN